MFILHTFDKTDIDNQEKQRKTRQIDKKKNEGQVHIYS